MHQESSNVSKGLAKVFPGSVQKVYGAKYPPLQTKNSRVISFGDSSNKKERKTSITLAKEGGKGTTDSFSKFQSNTADAWGLDDDELLHLQNVNAVQDIKGTADALIANHREKCLAKTEDTDVLNGRTGKPEAGHTMTLSASVAKASKSNSSGGRKRNPGADEVSKCLDNHILSVPDKDFSDSIGRDAVMGLPGRSVRLRGTELRNMHSLGARNVSSMNTLERERYNRFQQLLGARNADLKELRSLAWFGIPAELRPTIWKLLAGYLPSNHERRALTLERKRSEYFAFVSQYFSRQEDEHISISRQIQNDIPRMDSITPLPVLHKMFERVLYIWAIRHPASGYVQGMNDLVTPFAFVFISEYIDDDDISLHPEALAKVSEENLRAVEADCFWCLTRFLDDVQDSYTVAQPGIQRKLTLLRDLVARTDVELHTHLQKHSVEYLQFAFRWMNNLLTRELPLRCIVRLWDTYIAEDDGFAVLHVYVCAAFLKHFSDRLKTLNDFQGLMILLQNLPTLEWSDKNIQEILAQGYSYKVMFADALKHVATSGS